MLSLIEHATLSDIRISFSLEQGHLLPLIYSSWVSLDHLRYKLDFTCPYDYSGFIRIPLYRHRLFRYSWNKDSIKVTIPGTFVTLMTTSDSIHWPRRWMLNTPYLHSLPQKRAVATWFDIFFQSHGTPCPAGLWRVEELSGTGSIIIKRSAASPTNSKWVFRCSGALNWFMHHVHKCPLALDYGWMPARALRMSSS